MFVQLDPLRTDGDAGNEVRFKLQDTHDEYGPMAKDLRVRASITHPYFLQLFLLTLSVAVCVSVCCVTTVTRTLSIKSPALTDTD